MGILPEHDWAIFGKFVFVVLLLVVLEGVIVNIKKKRKKEVDE